jgi:4-hydroxy-tetrahydrodipicolinate synthase
MIQCCLEGDFGAAKKANDKLIEAYELMFAENNPAGVKAFLSDLGVIENITRLPVVPLSKELHDKVRSYLQKEIKFAIH